TPYMDEAERFNEIALLDNGKLLTVDTPDNIKSKMGMVIIEIVCKPIREAYKILKEKTNFEVQMFGDRLNVAVSNSEADSPGIKSLLESSGVEIFDLRKISPSLENVYIHLIKENEAVN